MSEENLIRNGIEPMSILEPESCKVANEIYSVKSLLGDQYTQREADAAVGLGVDHGIVVPKVIPSDVLAKISRNRIIAPEQEIKKMDVDDNVTAETTDTVAEDDAL